MFNFILNWIIHNVFNLNDIVVEYQTNEIINTNKIRSTLTELNHHSLSSYR